MIPFLSIKSQMPIRSGSSSKAASSWRQQIQKPFSSPRPERFVRSAHSAQPGVFEVQDVSPPPQSLGMHTLPPNTHNGDEIEVEGDSYVVQKVVFRFRLTRGKYKPAERRLEVRRTGRFLYNKYVVFISCFFLKKIR